MDSLKALVAKKRKEKEEEFDGRKYVKRGEIVDKRLKRLREAEQQELDLRATTSFSYLSHATLLEKQVRGVAFG